MKNKLGICFMMLGVILLLGALSLWGYNAHQNKAAEKAAFAALETIKEESNRFSSTVERDGTAVNVVDGNRYMGYVTLVEQNVQLPVHADCDLTLLETAPCRYTGTLGGNNLVICGHNYNSFFGPLLWMDYDEHVIFTDAKGISNQYIVESFETIAPEDVESMIESDFDLTLFTCTYGGTNRYAVRCNKE